MAEDFAGGVKGSVIIGFLFLTGHLLSDVVRLDSVGNWPTLLEAKLRFEMPDGALKMGGKTLTEFIKRRLELDWWS
jgi:hypothetical protein